MNRARATVFFALAAGIALSGCGGRFAYCEMEAPSLVLTQPLGQTVPGAPQVPVSVPQGIVTFTFNVPSIPLAGGSTTSQQAGFTVGSSMKLNQAALIMPSTNKYDFKGLDTLNFHLSSDL